MKDGETFNIYACGVPWFNDKAFKIRYFLGDQFDMSANAVIEAISVFLDENSGENQRKSASLLLRMLLTEKFYRFFMKGLEEELCGKVTSRNDRLVRVWREKIVSKGKCEKCGATDHLEAHHIKPWALFPEFRIDLENGVCLCHKCHAQEHRHDERIYRLMMAGEVA